MPVREEQGRSLARSSPGSRPSSCTCRLSAATSGLARRMWRRARIGCFGALCSDTSTAGLACRFSSQAGGLSSPPREATARGCPLFRPNVVSSNEGIQENDQPTLPKLSFSRARCVPFMIFKAMSLGMRRIIVALPALSGSGHGQPARPGGTDGARLTGVVPRTRPTLPAGQENSRVKGVQAPHPVTVGGDPNSGVSSDHVR